MKGYTKIIDLTRCIKALFICFVLVLITGNSYAIDPPSSVANKYESTIDWGISDDFNNGTIDWNKWTYVKVYGGSIAGAKYVYIPKNTGYVCIKGDAESKRGGGLSTLETRQYGFYTFKWRAYGFNKLESTVWIPSVWGCGQNFGEVNKRIDPFPNKRLEIDAMEIWPWNGKTTWRAQSLGWTGLYPNNTFHEARMIPGNTDFTNWHIQGLEYTPNYIRLWKYSNNSWHQVKTILFTDGPNSATSLNNVHKNPMYWICWNVYKHEQYVPKDSYLHVDYFHYYPFIARNRAFNVEEEANRITTLSQTYSSLAICSSTTTLGQSYPNPSTGNTIHIDYRIANDSHVNLTIYDIQGNLVFTVVNEQLSAGEYSKSINISELKSSGSYVYVLKTDDEILTKKMFVIR